MPDERTPQVLLDGTINNGKNEMTHIAVIFVPPDEPTPLSDIHAWTVNFSVDNATITLDLPTFLQMSNLLSENVVNAAKQAGLIPAK